MVRTSRRRVLGGVIFLVIVGIAWFIGRPLLYVLFDSNKPPATPSAEVIELLPPNNHVLAEREYPPGDTMGYGLYVAVIEPPRDSNAPVDDVLAAYKSRGWNQLGPAAIGSDEGCMSLTPVSGYLSDPSEDESRKEWVREAAPIVSERALVLTLSRC